MTISTATVPTASASRYLQQLAKHWSHRFEVSFDATRASIPLPLGLVELTADDAALYVRCNHNDAESIDKMRSVVADHLNRFAFREGELVFDWQVAD